MSKLQSHLDLMKANAPRSEKQDSFQLLLTIEEIQTMEPDLRKAKDFYVSCGCEVSELRMPVTAEMRKQVMDLRGENIEDKSEILCWHLLVPYRTE